MDDAVQVVTTALAVLGAVLGVMNAWRNYVHDRVSIDLILNYGISTRGEETVIVTVRNLSRFAVTIDSVSLVLPRRRHLALAMLSGCLFDPHGLPVRLESRTSLTVYVPVAALPDNFFDLVRRVSVTTACGIRVSRHRYFWRGKTFTAAS